MVTERNFFFTSGNFHYKKEVYVWRIRNLVSQKLK